MINKKKGKNQEKILKFITYFNKIFCEEKKIVT